MKKSTILFIILFLITSCITHKNVSGIWKYKEVTDDGVYYSFLILNEDGSLIDNYLYHGYQNEYIGNYSYDLNEKILTMYALDKTLKMKVNFKPNAMILTDLKDDTIYNYSKSSANEYKDYLEQSQNGKSFE